MNIINLLDAALELHLKVRSQTSKEYTNLRYPDTVRDYYTLQLSLGRGAGHTTWALDKVREGKAVLILPTWIQTSNHKLAHPDISKSIYSTQELFFYRIKEFPELIIFDAASLVDKETLNDASALLMDIVIGTTKTVILLS